MPKRFATRPAALRVEANLARRVERERTRLGWSYETLAKAMTEVGCTISKAAIYNIERGDPPRRITVGELTAFADVFGLEVPDLLTPVELMEQKWAEEVLAEFAAASRALDDAHAAILRAALRLAQMARTSPDLAEYVSHQWAASDSTRQWFGEFVGAEGVNNEQLSRLAEISVAFWDQVLVMLEQASASPQEAAN